MHNTSLKNRKEFYKKGFDIKKVSSWLKKLPYKPQFFFVDLGTETKIIKDKNKLNKLIFFKPNISLKELKKKLIKYLPEDVYYDRNFYKNPYTIKKRHLSNKNPCQELVFDVDPENLKCDNCNKKKFPKFCKTCSKLAIQNGFRIYKELKKQFKKVKLVFSGRGCHVHVLDKKAYKLQLKERKILNKKFKNLGIDPWVSYGKIKLIRLPYSLNSLSSRIVTPLKIEEINNFDPDKKRFLPNFLK
jgi:DNA primase catalytic subunit